MTRQELLKDLELSEKATEGPWGFHERWQQIEVPRTNEMIAQVGTPMTFNVRNNMEFIAVSRTRWPQTIRALVMAIESLTLISSDPLADAASIFIARKALAKIASLNEESKG